MRITHSKDEFTLILTHDHVRYQGFYTITFSEKRIWIVEKQTEVHLIIPFQQEKSSRKQTFIKTGGSVSSALDNSVYYKFRRLLPAVSACVTQSKPREET